ncbi:MAG: PAS domain-containing protein, partial [Synergistales bacterium]|nr:PAS domain-containing protein [Synergistales bacterium]
MEKKPESRNIPVDTKIPCLQKLCPFPEKDARLIELQGLYYDILFSELPDGVLVTDPEGVIQLANPAFYSIFGYSPEDVLGKPLKDISGKINIRKEIEINFPLLKNGTLRKKEMIRPRKDGSSVNVDIYGGPITYSGEEIGVYIIYADISARKNAEESLKRSEELFRLALDSTNEGIWDWNMGGREVFFSPRCYTMLGYQAGELQASLETWKSLLHPDDSKGTLNSLIENLEDDVGPFEMEFRLRKKNGQWLWILGRGKVAQRDRKGKPVRVVGTISDITERKTSESALEIQKEYMEKLFLNSPEGIVLVDQDGRVMKANHHFYQIFGYREEEVLGKEVDLLVANHPDILNDARHITEKIRKGIQVEREVYRSRKDGSLFPASIIAVPFHVELDKQAYYLIYRDISHRKEMEDALRESETR